MKSSWTGKVWVMTFLFGAVNVWPVQADGPYEWERWTDRISLYAGRHTDTRYLDIVQGETRFKNSYVASVTWSTTVDNWPPYAEWDAEIGLAHHWGEQRHTELNAAIVLRYIPWPNAQRWSATTAIGIGPSLASATPVIERARGGRTSRHLLYLPFEITVGPAHRRTEVFARVHHRSGGFDVFSRGRGSNFVGLGWRKTL